MDTQFQDLRYALRGLRREPAFTLAAALTIALGIAANTTIFSVANAFFLRPPAHVAAPDRLVAIFTSDYSGPRFGASSYPDLEALRERTEVFSAVAAYEPRPASLAVDGVARRITVECVSGNYFGALGIAPALGRLIRPDEAERTAQRVVVLGHALWERAFGADSAVLGRTVRINGEPFEVIGVAPRGFTGSMRGFRMDAWVPLGLPAITEPGMLDHRGARGLLAFARLTPGTTPERAQAAAAVVARRLHAAFPDAWTDITGAGRVITVLPERDARVLPSMRGAILGFVALLMGIVGLVLLLACVGLYGLVSGATAQRTREIGIRMALGARAGDVVCTMSRRGVTLVAAGLVLGLLAAAAASRVLRALLFGVGTLDPPGFRRSRAPPPGRRPPRRMGPRTPRRPRRPDGGAARGMRRPRRMWGRAAGRTPPRPRPPAPVARPLEARNDRGKLLILAQVRAARPAREG